MGQGGGGPAPSMNRDSERLRAELAALGFDVVRFTSLRDEVPGGAAFRDWLRRDFHADMAWLERSEAKRLNPQTVLAGARSMILLGVNYRRADDSSDTPKWARYALNRDYHDTIEPALKSAGKVLESWGDLGDRDYRYYVDTGPVLERSWAARAGVGFTGKNAMLISREFGNWLFLAAILVKCELPADEPVSRRYEKEPVGTLCGSCTACLDACPTGALPEPGVLDARRCISYLTIEHKGVIPPEWRRPIGDHIYGCDICAEVCPWNRFAQEAKSILLEERSHIGRLSLREILSLTAETFAAVFKGTAVKRLKLRGLLRNACVVAANRNAVDLLPELMKLADHHEPLVRAHAVWAIRCLGGEEQLGSQRSREQDPIVLAEFETPL